MKSVRNKAFFYRYLVSFLLILIIPLTGMMVYMSSVIRRNADNELITVNQSNLKHIVNLVDKNVAKFRSIASLALENPNLKPNLLGQSFFNYYKAIITLKDLTATNDLVNLFIVYDKVNDMVVSNLGTTPMQYFGEQVIRTRLDEGAPLREYVDGLTQPAYAYGEVNITGIGQRRSLLYFYPSSPINRTEDAVIIIVMALDNIIGMFQGQYNEQTNTFFLLDDTDRIVTTYGVDQPDLLTEYPVARRPSAAVTEIVQLDGNRYCMSAITSDQTGWTYINAVSFESAGKALTDELSWCFLCFGMLFAVGGIGMYIAIRLNYSPLLRLKRQVEPLVSGEALNEEEMIQAALQALLGQMEKLKNEMHSVRPAALSYLLQRAVNGETVGELGPLIRENGVDQKDQRVLVAILPLDKQEFRDTIENLDSMQQDNLRVNCVHDAFRNTLAAIFSFEETEKEEAAQGITVKLLKRLNRTVFMGKAYPPEAISRAYFEAYITCQLLEHVPLSEKIYSFDTLTDSLPATSGLFTSGIIKELEIAILRGDVQTVLAFPDTFKQSVLNGNVPYYHLSYLYKEMFRTTVRCFNDRPSRADLASKLLDYLYLQQPIARMEQVFDIASFFCATVYFYMQRQNSKRDPMLADILAFVDEHSNERDFSVQRISDHFNLSPSWLSHYFKANAHITLLEYVKGRRMQYAQRLMTDGGVSIQDVSDMLGYSNLSSFIRSFKKVVGITPGQFKELTEKHGGQPASDCNDRCKEGFHDKGLSD